MGILDFRLRILGFLISDFGLRILDFLIRDLGFWNAIVTPGKMLIYPLVYSVYKPSPVCVPAQSWGDEEECR